MKNVLAALTSVLLNFLLLPFWLPVFAQEGVCPPGFENLCKIGPHKNSNFFGNIIAILFIIAIILSLIFLIWGGIRWIMSSGDKAKIEQARSTIIAAIIGLVISLLGYFIVTLIVSLFTGATTLKLSIPTLK